MMITKVIAKPIASPLHLLNTPRIEFIHGIVISISTSFFCHRNHVQTRNTQRCARRLRSFTGNIRRSFENIFRTSEAEVHWQHGRADGEERDVEGHCSEMGCCGCGGLLL